MRFAVFISLAAIAAAQPASAPEVKPGQPVDLQVLSRTVRTVNGSTQRGEAVKAQVEKLLADSASLIAAGRSGEARHRLVNALTLLNGKAWDQKEEFVWSLALRPDKVVADSSLP